MDGAEVESEFSTAGTAQRQTLVPQMAMMLVPSAVIDTDEAGEGPENEAKADFFFRALPEAMSAEKQLTNRSFSAVLKSLVPSALKLIEVTIDACPISFAQHLEEDTSNKRIEDDATANLEPPGLRRRREGVCLPTLNFL